MSDPTMDGCRRQSQGSDARREAASVGAEQSLHLLQSRVLGRRSMTARQMLSRQKAIYPREALCRNCP
jgi:hypothetical protein